MNTAKDNPKDRVRDRVQDHDSALDVAPLDVAPLDVALLSANDPAPVMWVNRESQAPVLLLCEHAGNAVPAAHGTLGLPSDQLNSHIAWDIGAAAVARTMADLLQAPLLMQRYSRLVIDCNRPPGSNQSIPELSLIHI